MVRNKIRTRHDIKVLMRRFWLHIHVILRHRLLFPSSINEFFVCILFYFKDINTHYQVCISTVTNLNLCLYKIETFAFDCTFRLYIFIHLCKVELISTLGDTVCLVFVFCFLCSFFKFETSACSFAYTFNVHARHCQ